jgi:Flp pilus assembly protein TadD
MLTRSCAAWVPPTLLAVMTAAAFANAVPNGFVWIDHWQVESGGLIASSLAQLWAAFHQPLGVIPGWDGPAPYARPLVIAVLSLVHAVASLDPAAYHLVLVALHLANALLAYSILLVLSAAPAAAFFTAAIFALHPLQTAAVSWVSGIADPLCALFVLLAFRLQLAASQRPARGLLLRLGAVLSFALALGAKETALVFPALLAAAYFLFPAVALRRYSRPLRKDVVALLPFILLVAADFGYRSLVLGASALGGGFGQIPLAVRLWTAPRLVVSYLTLPLRFRAFTICDDYALSTGPDAMSLAAACAIAALLAGVALCWRRWPQLSFAVLWLLATLLPGLNLVPILHYRADRFFYLPLIGWSLAAVTLVRGLLDLTSKTASTRFRRVAAGAGLAVLVLLGFLTVRRNALFANDRTLFEATVRVSPLCREAHTALGDAYLRAGRNGDAVAQYHLALAAQPGRASYVVLPKVFINLGMAQLLRHDYAAAEEAFRQAHQLQPHLLHPLFGLGISNLALGRVGSGVRWLEQAYEHDPTDPDVSFNLALGYDRLGRAGEASAMYHHYLDAAPRGRARGLAEERLRVLGQLKPSP